jgi:hypothetical protein
MTPGWGCSSFQPGACRGDVAFAGRPAGVGEGVVEVVVVRMGAAAGGGAGGGAGAHQVPELSAGDVAVFGVAVVAAALGDRGDGDVQVAQEVRERGGLLLVRAVPGSAAMRRRYPGVGAAGAAVRGGGAVGGQEGGAPAGAGMGGGGLQQAAGVVVVGQSPAAGFAGGGGPAEGGADRDGQAFFVCLGSVIHRWLDVDIRDQQGDWAPSTACAPSQRPPRLRNPAEPMGSAASCPMDVRRRDRHSRHGTGATIN